MSSDIKAAGNSVPDYKTAPLSDVDINKTSAKSSSSSLAFSLVVSIIVLIVLCLILAAVVSRCRKRGRLFRYGNETVEFSKLMQDNDDE